MARTKGTYSLSANIETLASAPLDARERVATKADLTAVGSFPYFYEGMQVYVVSEKKRYTLKGNDPTVLESWEAEGTNLNVKVYKPSGSILFENLPVLSEDVLGNVYDVIDAFTTTSDFIEGAGVDYPAHTNVSVNVTGTAQNPVYKFDTALGNIDLSGYQEKMQYVTLPLPTDDLEGVIVQFIGATTLDHTNGYFYKCVEDPQNAGTYIWVEHSTQSDEDTKTQVEILPVATSALEDKIYQYIGETTQDYINGHFYKCVEDPETVGSYIWQAITVQEGGSGGGSLEQAITAAIDVGGISSGTSYQEGTSYDTLWDNLLNPTLYPTLTAPSATISGSGTKLLEVGATQESTITVTFSRGSISPAYGTSGYRSGEATGYSLNGGTGQAGNTFTETVTGSNNAFTATVAYGAGEQPKDSKGNDYQSPLAAGSVTTGTVSYEFVNALWANTSNIATVAKQSLTSRSAKVKSFSFPATTVANPEIFDVPASWTVTTVEVLNTLSNQWETATEQFTVTDTTHNDAGGTSTAYKRYTCNLGMDLGARQVRVKWS